MTTERCTNRFAAVGLLPGAAGAVILPETDSAVAEAVRAGRFDEVPAEAGFLRGLSHGKVVESLDRVNAALLAGDADSLTDLASTLDPQSAMLLHAAAYRMGAAVVLPESSEELDPRVDAYVTATRAHEAAANGDLNTGLDLLLQAAAITREISPGASARYVGEAASLVAQSGQAHPLVMHELEAAAKQLEGLAFEDLRGELLMARADMLMTMGSERPSLMQQAVLCFQQAIQALPRKRRPVAYAMCHVNIAVAYLSMPMNEHAGKLRAAMAVQSLREALEILTPAEHGEMWEAATLNLANALQHLPSAHVSQNLVEAVSLYESMLERRAGSGVARARLLANMGNAQAHLGRLDEAERSLSGAHAIFESLGDRAAIEGIGGVLAEIKSLRNAEPAKGGTS
ncbi:MAG: hypothetical protein AAGJ54_06100 [Planctomycetota bacterium]